MPTVMIVDDEPDTLKLVTLMLSRAGYQVLPVERGKDALVQVSKQRPDIILLDVMLPDIDGFLVAQKLHAQMANTPPIIFFTSMNAPEDQVTGRTLGDGYLVKPVRLTTLLEVVHKLIGGEKPAVE
jgi:two-component system, OmpR family, response regulator